MLDGLVRFKFGLYLKFSYKQGRDRFKKKFGLYYKKSLFKHQNMQFIIESDLKPRACYNGARTVDKPKRHCLILFKKTPKFQTSQLNKHQGTFSTSTKHNHAKTVAT